MHSRDPAMQRNHTAPTGTTYRVPADRHPPLLTLEGEPVQEQGVSLTPSAST